jgi:hypothetical protein
MIANIQRARLICALSRRVKVARVIKKFPRAAFCLLRCPKNNAFACEHPTAEVKLHPRPCSLLCTTIPPPHRFAAGSTSLRAPAVDPPAPCLDKASPRRPRANRRRASFSRAHLFFPGASREPPRVSQFGAVVLPPWPPCPPQAATQHGSHKVPGEIAERYVSTALFFPR